MPQISVIVPVYKVEPYLRRCIDSILSQTFTDFELILVDDGSPDNCPAICDEYALKDNRIHVIHQKNGGLSAARNAGIDYAFASSDSEWISFVDSDDWVHKRYLEFLYIAVSKFQVNISQCKGHKTSNNTNLPEINETLICVTPDEEYLQYYHPNAWGKLYHKNCFIELRFPEGQIYEDVAIWYKLLFAQKRIAVVDESLYYYFYRRDSIVNTDWTPKQLDQVDAWVDQIASLKTYQNKKVYKEAVDRFSYVLASQLERIKYSNKISYIEKLYYSHMLRNLLRKQLRYNKEYFNKNRRIDWYNNKAYPVFSWIYWSFKGVFGKIRRLFHE